MQQSSIWPTRWTSCQQRAQDVLARYEETVQHGHAAQILNGSAGNTNLITGAEIKEAQMKIQMRFGQVNEMLRGGARPATPTPTRTTLHQISSVHEPHPVRLKPLIILSDLEKGIHGHD